MLLEWGVGPVRFELTCPDSALAQDIFGLWPNPNGQLWRQYSLPEATPEALQSAEYQAIQSLYEHPDLLVLHGSFLTKEESTLLILGAPEAGKSTLALALWQAGWQLASDDCIVVESGTSRAWPGPRRISLRHSSRDLFPEALWQTLASQPASQMSSKGLLVSPRAFGPWPQEGRRITQIVVLEPGSAWQQLDATDALLALIPFCNKMVAGDLGQALCACSPLAQNGSVWRLNRGPLSQMVERISFFC